MKRKKQILGRLEKAEALFAYYWSYLPEFYDERLKTLKEAGSVAATEYLKVVEGIVDRMVPSASAEAELIGMRNYIEKTYNVKPPEDLYQIPTTLALFDQERSILKWILERKD
jgi:hypothetical protein